ncbi:MAG: hypothetical protein U0802_12025 [Candidatus Binatia bacterium]
MPTPPTPGCARGVAPADLVVYGESLGGPIATDLAAHQAIGGLVLESAPSSILGVAQHHYPWLPVAWFLSLRYDALARPPRVRAPVLILHSLRDEIALCHGGRSPGRRRARPRPAGAPRRRPQRRLHRRRRGLPGGAARVLAAAVGGG